jgi:hypothetical protein
VPGDFAEAVRPQLERQLEAGETVRGVPAPLALLDATSPTLKLRQQQSAAAPGGWLAAAHASASMEA